MYISQTTFVIGAGASLELGFPTGQQLKGQIAEAVDIRFDIGNRQKSGDYQIAEALRGYADFRSGSATEYNEYLGAGWHIARAMPQSISIDNFIESQEDERVTRMAKLGIASCLIDAERQCWERFQEEQHSDNILWANIENTWIHHLFQTLSEGVRKSSVDQILASTNFVIFNYDRSLEHFLPHALVNYFGIELSEAQGIVSNANFIHPYGVIGKLPWQTSAAPALQFGSGNKGNLLEISKAILTFSEQIADEDQIAVIRQTVHNAEQLVFLGFAYHPSNMQLLQPTRTEDTARVVATAFGLSAADRDVIIQDLRKLCIVDDDIRDVVTTTEEPAFQAIVDNNATCSSLFQTYRRTLLS